MYKYAIYQAAIGLPKLEKANIIKVHTPYGAYTGIIVGGVRGQYSYVNLLNGHRVFESSDQLTWNTVIPLENGTQILAVWKSIKEWIQDGSPLN